MSKTLGQALQESMECDSLWQQYLNNKISLDEFYQRANNVMGGILDGEKN